MATEARRLVDEQFRLLRQAFAGHGGNPLPTLHEEVTFFVPGSLPVSGTHDYAFLRDMVFGAAGPGVPCKEGFGHYSVEYIEEGNRVVVIAKARLSGRTGEPYNNTFFMLYEIRDGKIYRFIEFLDGSLFMQANLDTHLEPDLA